MHFALLSKLIVLVSLCFLKWAVKNVLALRPPLLPPLMLLQWVTLGHRPNQGDCVVSPRETNRDRDTDRDRNIATHTDMGIDIYIGTDTDTDTDIDTDTDTDTQAQTEMETETETDMGNYEKRVGQNRYEGMAQQLRLICGCWEKELRDR